MSDAFSSCINPQLARALRHEQALRKAAYYGAFPYADLQLEALADTMSTSSDGEGWTHWWRAFVARAQRRTP